MGDSSSTTDPPLPLAIRGDVRLGVPLTGVDREDSVRRGGDGRIAEFRGGSLVAGGEKATQPSITGKFMTLCIRLRHPAGKWDAPVLRRLEPGGGITRLVYGTDLTGLTLAHRERQRIQGGRALTYLWQTTPGSEHVRPAIYQTSEKGRLGLPDYQRGVLRLSSPMDLVGPSDWHDLVIRFRDANLELFVDGVLVDEEWPHGALDRFTGPLCLGGPAGEKSGEPVFHGQVDHLALWNRALSDAEIESLSGGAESVAARRKAIHGDNRLVPQYWRPSGYNAFVGDCMPFYHQGTFHFFYLFDRRHHGSKWTMGAHQFGHLSTRDLAHWEEHPLALSITDQTEPSLGTGMCMFRDDMYYLFYIPHYRRGYFKDTVLLGDDVRVATSRDGIHFTKRPGSVVPLEYLSGGDINPTVFPAPRGDHYDMAVGGKFFRSSDLLAWKETQELTSRDIPGWACATAFEWNGWNYFTAWQRVRKTRGPIDQGGWEDAPGLGDALFCPQVAAFTGNRRLLVGFVDDGAWGSYSVFRELLQEPDGNLGTRWVPEMLPPTGDRVPPQVSKAVGKVASTERGIALAADSTAMLKSVPRNLRITARIRPGRETRAYGLVVRSPGERTRGMEVKFHPEKSTVLLSPLGIDAPAPALTGGKRLMSDVRGVSDEIRIDLILKDDLLDLCLDDRRTYIVRVPSAGNGLFFFAEGGTALIEDLTIRPLLNGRSVQVD
jgi:hypothetical protein